eukprot:4442198-Pyramimonas_sp.AAC.1
MDVLGSQGWASCGRFLVDWPPLYHGEDGGPRRVVAGCAGAATSGERAGEEVWRPWEDWMAHGNTQVD